MSNGSSQLRNETEANARSNSAPGSWTLAPRCWAGLVGGSSWAGARQEEAHAWALRHRARSTRGTGERANYSLCRIATATGKTGDVPPRRQGLDETSSTGTCRELAVTGRSWSPATDPGWIQAGVAARALERRTWRRGWRRCRQQRRAGPGRVGEEASEMAGSGQQARRRDAEQRTSSGKRARRRKKGGSGRPALHADPSREASAWRG